MQGYILTDFQSSNGNNINDSDFDPFSRRTPLFILLSGESNQNIDAGLIYGPVPLEWLGFTAKYNGSYVDLDWQTGSEFNTDKFIIERKVPSSSLFQSIVQVKAKNNNAVLNEYHDIDLDVIKSGIYYYRIKQLDINGTFTYSKIEAVNISKTNTFNLEIYPIPVKDLLNVNFTLSENSTLEFRVFDENGKNVYTVPNFELYKAGNHKKLIDVSILTQGPYYLEVKTTLGVVIKKFIVVK